MKPTWRILLIEDDRQLGPLTLEALNHSGHDAVLANSPDAAYAHLSQPNEFDVVLLDLELEQDRGEDLVRKLRREGFRIPPLIIFSAQPIGELERSAREIGAQAVILKPASIAEVNEVLRATLA